MKSACSPSAVANARFASARRSICRWMRWTRRWTCCASSAVDCARLRWRAPRFDSGARDSLQPSHGRDRVTDMQTWLENLGLRKINPGVFCGEWRGGGAVVDRPSPTDGQSVAGVQEATAEDYELAVNRAREAFLDRKSTRLNSSHGYI